jgi:release factor glutamine methyltransferase
MKQNILDYEPHIALFVPDENPLVFYKKIANLASESLTVGGKLFFEINEQFSNTLIEFLSLNGFVDIKLKKDINDKYRMIKAICK